MDSRYPKHYQITGLMHGLGYVSNDKGVCEGISQMLKMYFMNNDASGAHELLKCITKLLTGYQINSEGVLVAPARMKKDNYRNIIDQLKRVQEKIKKYGDIALLSPDENRLYELSVVMAGSQLYYDPTEYAHVFPDKMNQQKVEEISKVIIFESLKSICHVICDPTMKTEAELCEYLSHLMADIKKLETSVGNALGIVVGCLDHAMTIQFEDGYWHLFDSNQLELCEKILNTEALSKAIRVGMDPRCAHDKFMPLTFNIYTKEIDAETVKNMMSSDPSKNKSFSKANVNLLIKNEYKELNRTVSESKGMTSILNLSAFYDQIDIIRVLKNQGKVSAKHLKDWKVLAEVSASNGNMAILQTLKEELGPEIFKKEAGLLCARYAIEAGYGSTFEYLYKHDLIPFDASMFFYPNHDIALAKSVAEHGLIQVIERLMTTDSCVWPFSSSAKKIFSLDQPIATAEKTCLLYQYLAEQAATYGQVDLLQWLYKTMYALHSEHFQALLELNADLMKRAAFEGQCEIILLLHKFLNLSVNNIGNTLIDIIAKKYVDSAKQTWTYGWHGDTPTQSDRKYMLKGPQVLKEIIYAAAKQKNLALVQKCFLAASGMDHIASQSDGRIPRVDLSEFIDLVMIYATDDEELKEICHSFSKKQILDLKPSSQGFFSKRAGLNVGLVVLAALAGVSMKSQSLTN